MVDTSYIAILKQNKDISEIELAKDTPNIVTFRVRNHPDSKPEGFSHSGDFDFTLALYEENRPSNKIMVNGLLIGMALCANENRNEQKLKNLIEEKYKGVSISINYPYSEDEPEILDAVIIRIFHRFMTLRDASELNIIESDRDTIRKSVEKLILVCKELYNISSISTATT